MTIAELERRSGLTRANIRFYEAEDLLRPARRENGYRDYSEEDLALLLRVRLLRELGLPLAEIRQLRGGDLALGAALDAILRNMVRMELRLHRLHREFHLKYHPALQMGMRIGPYANSREYVDDAWLPFVALYVPELAPEPWSLSVYRPQRWPVAARIRLVFDRLVEYFGEGGRFP